MSRFDVHYLGECIRTCVHVVCSRIGGVHIPQSENGSHSLSIEFGLFVSLRWFFTTKWDPSAAQKPSNSNIIVTYKI